MKCPYCKKYKANSVFQEEHEGMFSDEIHVTYQCRECFREFTLIYEYSRMEDEKGNEIEE